MKLVIHRGAHEIGGTCIQLSDQGTTILLDLGLPLSPDSKPINLEGVNPDALIISHPHLDHYGLMESLGGRVPIYIGRLGKSLIDAVRVFTKQGLLKGDYRVMRRGQSFRVGSFTIKPYLVDHSSPEAFAFLIESNGKRVFYSGDFRAHGRKSSLFERMTAKPPKDIDALLMEGTMLGRSNRDFPDEKHVEKKIFEVIGNQKNISFLVTSSQNIDRIVSAFRACLHAEKIMVVDIYTAWVLQKLELVTSHVPNMTWKQVRVYIPGGQYEKVKKHPEYFGSFQSQVFRHRITDQELISSPARFLYLTRISNFKKITNFLGQEPINLIYSQWLGYLQKDNWDSFGTREMAGLRQEPRVNFIYAHTSGHAPLEDLKTFAQAIKPKKLIPVHTEFPKEFKEYFKNVFELDDGQELVL